MLKIFADHCVHTDLIEALRKEKFKVVRALEVSLASASDKEIFDYTERNRLVLLSFDRGFGSLKRFAIDKSFGIVIVEVERMSKNLVIKRTVGFFKKATARSLRGSLSIIGPVRVRFRLKGETFKFH